MKKLLVLAILLVGFSAVYSQNYNRAIGVRGPFGLGITYKHFLNEKAAIEGVFNFRPFVGAGYRWHSSQLMGLFLVHNPLSFLEGLQWYFGGGVSLTTWGGDYKTRFNENQSLGFGIHGAIGLDYKFEKLPINVTVDWIPSIIIGSYYNGFAGDAGGLGARYTF